MSLDKLRPESKEFEESSTSSSQLNDILIELKILNKYLERIVGSDLRDEIEEN